MTQPDTTVLNDISNEEFLCRFAKPGVIGLATGDTLIDRAIQLAERHVHNKEHRGTWTHAFFFQGKRSDGHHWVIESDLIIQHKHILLGVQESRINKFFGNDYTSLAILDFQLNERQIQNLLTQGLDLVANKTHYSIRELIGTLVALRHPKFRNLKNPLARDASFFCSAFVRHVYSQAEIDLLPGLHIKNTTPDDLFLSSMPHKTYLLKRD
jgi:hypothetical protein